MMCRTRSDKWRANGLGLSGGKWLGVMIPGAVLLFLFVLPSVPGAQDEVETVFWRVGCERAEDYLAIYPNGAYVAEAWACLEPGLGLGRAARVSIQEGLVALGYEAGPADGLFGPATRRAIRAWQTAKEFVATGYLTQAQADAWMAQGRAATAKHQGQEEAAARAEAERQQHEAAARAEAERQRAEAERQRRKAAKRVEVTRRLDWLAEREARAWENRERKAFGVVVSFHQWPDSDQARVIEEYLRAEDLEKAKVLERFKVWSFKWPELRSNEKALEICENFPEMAILYYCEPNPLLLPDYYW